MVKIRGFLFMRIGFITRCKASQQDLRLPFKNAGL